MTIDIFFIKLFVTGLVSSFLIFLAVEWYSIPFTLTEKIMHWITNTLFVISCVLTGIGFFGLIWTF